MSLLGAVPTGGLGAPSHGPAEGGAAGGGAAGRGWAGVSESLRGHWRLGAQKPLGLHFPRMETELLPSQGFPQMPVPAPKQVH